MFVNWHKSEGGTWVSVFLTDSFLRCIAFKVCPIRFSSLHRLLRAEGTSSWQPRKMLLCLGICLHSHHSSSPCMNEWLCTCVDMCWMIVYFVLFVSVCVQCAFSSWKGGRVQRGELGSSILSTALLHVQLHSSSNREQSSTPIQSQ